MDSFNFVNLIQSATISVCAIGALLLARSSAFRGVAALLVLVAVASLINILEESGVTRDIYLISPVFVMLFGPATYLGIKHLLSDGLAAKDGLHLLPCVPVLFFTSHVQEIIAIGTFWRLLYAAFTARLLLEYNRKLDEQRSDADEFSFLWLVWVITLTALFNLLDLVRLNSQQWLNHDINLLGQGVNNLLWLVVVMLIIVKLTAQKKPPQMNVDRQDGQDSLDQVSYENQGAEYQPIFAELQRLLTEQKWYLQPRLTLTELSQLTGLQARDISRAINLQAKKSFNEYINQFRIETVCSELKSHSSAPLLQIAMDAGFSSKAAFNSAFKTLMSQTPTQYKTSLLNTET